MKLKLFGFTFRVELLILMFVLYLILSGHLICSCSKLNFIEAFEVAKSLGEATLDYRMGDGVKGSWDGKQKPSTDLGEMVIDGTQVPLNGTLFFFKENKGTHTHCPSSYSKSTGCVGLTAEQSKYLNSRGGNRIIGEF